MTIDVVALMACCGCTRQAAERYVWHLNDAMHRFGITGPARVACFLAQVAVESDRLEAVEENLYYTSADRLRLIFPSLFRTGQNDPKQYLRNPGGLSQLRYHGYHGRGLLQLTWRPTYASAGEALGFDYLNHPELVIEPQHAALTAAWFFAVYKTCLEPADRMDVRLITLRVNGPAMLKLAERSRRTITAYKLLSV